MISDDDQNQSGPIEEAEPSAEIAERGKPKAQKKAEKDPSREALKRSLSAQIDHFDSMFSRKGAKAKSEKDTNAAALKSKELSPEEKKAQRKFRIKMGSYGAGFLIFAYAVYWLFFIPYTGSLAYGMCKVFLELNTQYPSTIRIHSVQDTGQIGGASSSVRIWYTSINAYGEYSLEPFTCRFQQSEETGFELERVLINSILDNDPKNLIAQTKIDRFNAALPSIIANPPSLVIPPRPRNPLAEVQFDVDMFRRRLF